MTPPHSSADFPEDPLISDSENFALSPADAAAIDALVEAGFEAVNVSSDSGGRVLHAASFLNALGAGLPATSETDSLLIHATLARVAREARIASIDRALGVGSGAVLSEPDREAVDALLDASFDSDATPEPVRARAHRAARLISLVNAGTGPTNAESLIQQTLARAQHAADEQDRMLNFEAEQERMATRRLRFSDAVAVAAVLAIGTAVLGPTLGVVRDAS